MARAKGVRRFAAMLIGLAAALVLIEFGLRQFAPQGVVTDWVRYEAVPDAPGVGYRMRPNQWVPGRLGGPINALGLRGAAWPSGPRTLVLGDSFVFGAGVELPATFVERLNDTLDDRNVVNGGTPGYGTWREMAWLETYGDELDLDAVVLCVFEGNDFQDNLETRAPEVVGGVLFGPDAAQASAGRAWLNRLHIWRLLSRRVHKSQTSQGTKPSAAPAALQDLAAVPGLASSDASNGPASAASSAAVKRSEAVLDQFARLQAPRLAVYVPSDLQDQALARRIALCFDMTSLALEGITEWCVQRQVELRVVLIPDVLAVDAAQRERALVQNDDVELRTALAGGLDLYRPRRALAEWTAAQKLPFLDLTEPFRAATQSLLAADPRAEGLYLFGDSHWNAAGHQLAAERIAEWLRSVR